MHFISCDENKKSISDKFRVVLKLHYCIYPRVLAPIGWLMVVVVFFFFVFFVVVFVFIIITLVVVVFVVRFFFDIFDDFVFVVNYVSSIDKF